MTALAGPRSERLTSVESQLAMLRRDLDLLEARPSQGRQSSDVRLARIEGTPGGGDNTYAVTFLNGTFTEAAGVTTPTYDDRGTGFAYNLIQSPPTPPTGGEIVIVVRWSGRWWFEWE